jgi:hypothetical protein
MTHLGGFIRQKRRALAQEKLSPVRLAVAIAVIALLTTLFIVIFSRRSAVVMLQQSEESLIASVYVNITALERSYQEMNLPGADVKNTILPKMRLDLNAAKTVNQILVEVYGDDRAVLTEEMFAQIDESIGYMSDIIDMGKSQDEAKQQMGACMEKVQTAMLQRFPKDTHLMPVTT